MKKNIEKPSSSNITPERMFFILQHPELKRWLEKSGSPYAAWEKVKYFELPKGIKAEEVWAAIKLLRKSMSRPTLIREESGEFFSWGVLPGLEDFLHQVDMQLGGNLMIAGGRLDETKRRQFLSRGVLEEAIASSQLEGAHTTRQAAKKMILEGRKPHTKDDKMIVNNYQAIRLIEDDLKDQKLDESTLFRLHEVLMRGTREESEIARYRRDEDDIVVGGSGPEIYHVPPREEFLKTEIKRFIDYANNNLKDPNFVHPVLKAIFLHFWFGYLHPFTDGNGRMARSLFYWYLLRENYWAFAFLPLSTVIKKSRVQYQNAFIFTEQDDADLTYFLDYNIRKIQQAMREFEDYVQKKQRENAQMVGLSRSKFSLNERQIQILRYLFENCRETTSITTYQRVYEVARMTAIKDLAKLKELGFLTSKKVGRTVYYSPTQKLRQLFLNLG